LHSADQEKAPYQIVVINAEQFDHHASYLARAIKAMPQLAHLMLVLALPMHLLGFEKERAYFGGFACVLNLAKSDRLAERLLNSWLGWSAKVNFVHAEEITLSHNHILLVEDDPIPQRVAQRQLKELGYEVDIAPDGHTALKLLGKKRYNLVFMDIGLPDISGLEVTAEFRKCEHKSFHTPIVGLTIHSLDSDQQSGLQAGMDEYLVKPLLHERLKEVLDHWIVKEN
jgi:CheY-like chemotaxis protein